MSNYGELFTINITHNYYVDTVCPDFSLEPTPRCRELLKDHRILLKSEVGGIQLVLPVTAENTPFIDISDISKFSFYMKLRETTFDIYTDISDMNPLNSDEIYGYNNQSIRSGELTYEAIKRSDANLPENNADVFAIIDIYADQISADLYNPSHYTIDFTAKAITWSYYFITNKDHQKDLEVEMEVDNPIIFNEEQNIQNDPIGRELQETYPNNEIYMFQSDDVVAYREEGRKNITLNIYKPQGSGPPEISIEHLPNPGMYDNGVKMLHVTIDEGPGGGH